MGNRGVTRPMHGHAADGNDHGHSDGARHDSKGHEGHEGHASAQQGGGGHEMTQEQRMAMAREHHRQTLWVYWSLVMLGIWVAVSPFTFGYGSGVVTPSGGREVWLSLWNRIAAMTWSDVLCGLLLVLFGWRSLTPGRPVSRWMCCFVGIWLSAAPIVFWAPTAVAYLNDTIAGAAAICLSVLVPGMPGMILYMKMGPPVPPGWSYNPSSWPQRWIMIATGFGGWLVSRYLAAYQLGYIGTAWDPFFGDGTTLVLNSKMSHSWPVSDAALGSFAYTFEFLMGWMGSPSRWRTMPWMVLFFGILVIPLGLTHILLVISQPIVVGHWCTFCLLAAAIMLPMIPLETDEVVAMGQHLVESKRRGESLWRVFWKGGSPDGSQPDDRSPALAELPSKPGEVLKASVWGVSVPWTLAVASALGVWLMFAPAVFGTRGWAANLDHLCGALTVTVAVICMGEVVRIGRYVLVPLGLAVAAAPWFLSGSNLAAQVVDLGVGLSVIALAFPRGPKKERYGLWDRFVR